METFFEKIECTFKSNKLSKYCEDVIHQAKKNLCRDAKESHNQIQKITKSLQANSVQEYKLYITGLNTEKERISELMRKAMADNQEKKAIEDFNDQHFERFENTLECIGLIMDYEKRKSVFNRMSYRLEKLIVSNLIKVKEIEIKKQENEKEKTEIK